MKTTSVILTICFIFLMGSMVSAQNKYIGADKCKMCHNKPQKGEQYNKWKKEKHSNAMASLKSQKSLDYAKKNGIADPSTDQKCVKCHSTASSVDKKLHSGIKVAEGVSCETCHGPGSNYKTDAIMSDRKLALTKGMIMPEEKMCLKCHNNKENPFMKPFNYKTALTDISHPDPTLKK